MADASAAEVRPIGAPEEYRACQAVQRRAWGIAEDGYLVPVATMVAAQKMGGLVLGAFRQQRLVGFSFAFLGRLRGQLVLYSQLTAVDPAAQGGGVGRALKAGQRRWACEQGLAAVAWTFDPLQAGNAAFNLATLGATCRVYEVDLYGPRTDRLNAGLATDRLLAEWPTRAEPAALPALGAWAAAPDVVASAPVAEGVRRPAAAEPVTTESPPRLRLEIPASLDLVRAHDPALAHAWRAAVRRAFVGAVAAGYVAVGFLRGERPCYLLERP